MSLFRWMVTRKCPQCARQLDKNARHCRHCGFDNPESWRQCLSCGASVGADSAKCRECRADLLSQPRNAVFGDRWKRERGIFAMRVPIETPHDRLRHGIQVDEGMRGALYRNGVFREELGPGYHPMTSFWERLTGGDRTGHNIEAIVANADTTVCMLTADESARISTAGHEKITYAGILLEVELDDLQRLQRRFLPYGTFEVSESALLDGVRSRVIEALRILVRGLTVEQLGDAVDLRRRCEAFLNQDIPRLLLDYGLRFRGVHDLTLEGPALQQLRTREAQISTAAREYGWEEALRKIQLSGELSKFKDERGFQEQMDIWSHDFHLSAMDRRHLVTMRGIEMKRQADLAEAEAQRQLKMRETESVLEREDIIFDRDMAHVRTARVEQMEIMAFLAAQEAKKLDEDLARKIQHDNASADNQVKLAAAYQHLRPYPVVTVITEAHGARPAAPPFPHGSPPPYSVPLETLAQRYIPCVGVVVVSLELGGARKMSPRGTAWVARNTGAVATNAHVAKNVAEACRHGAQAWVIFSGSEAPVPIRSIRIHPDYGSRQTAHHPLPSWDVALMDLAGPLPGPGLPIADRHTLLSLAELQTVAYLGFPMEGLVGGGVNHERPRAIAKRGVISSLQDWDMRDTADPAGRMLIVHDLGVAGGASGSPLFDISGNVIGIISSGNMELIPDPESGGLRRIPSAAHLNFAQRIDALSGNILNLRVI